MSLIAHKNAKVAHRTSRLHPRPVAWTQTQMPPDSDELFAELKAEDAEIEGDDGPPPRA